MTEIKNIGESVELATIPMDRYKALLAIEKSIEGPGFKRTITDDLTYNSNSTSWPLRKYSEWALASETELLLALKDELRGERDRHSDIRREHSSEMHQLQKELDRLRDRLREEVERRPKKRFWFW